MVQLEAVITKMPDLEGLKDKAFGELPDATGQWVVSEVQRGALWPSDTGASKAGFGYQIRDGAASITNTQDYAPYVEARTQAVLTTIQDNDSDLAGALDKVVQEALNG